MRAYPLCRIERSADGQRWELLSDETSIALFDELKRCWAFVPNEPESNGEHVSIAGRPYVPETADDMVDAVVRALERGAPVALHFAESFAVYLRRAVPTFAPLGIPQPFTEYTTRGAILGLRRW